MSGNIEFPVQTPKKEQNEIEDDGIRSYMLSGGQIIIAREEETEDGIFFHDPMIGIMVPQPGGNVGMLFQPITVFSTESTFGPINFAGVLFEFPMKELFLEGYRNQVQEIRAQRSGLTLARNIPNLNGINMKPGKS